MAFRRITAAISSRRHRWAAAASGWISRPRRAVGLFQALPTPGGGGLFIALTTEHTITTDFKDWFDVVLRDTAGNTVAILEHFAMRAVRAAALGGASSDARLTDVLLARGRLDLGPEFRNRDCLFANQPHSVHRGDGLRLRDCYITASARCAPPGNKPTTTELARCRPYLTAEIRLLRDVKVVVTLGRIAHESWLKASGWWDRLPPRARPPFGHGARARLPDGTIVISSYHPSRQNTNTGKLTRRMWHRVFAAARRLV